MTDFYIGYHSRASASVARWLKPWILLLLATSAALAFFLVRWQQTIGQSTFEWGVEREFSGYFTAHPTPMLLVLRPGQTPEQRDAFSTYLTVAPFKFGLPAGKVKAYDGKWVHLRGTLIYRDGHTMLEVIPDSMKKAPDAGTSAKIPPLELGRHTLRGEIVDSKCYWGVMNPGNLKPHRACAIHCIRGGIPPVFLVREASGTAHYYLLLGPEAEPIHEAVLPFVAEPLKIEGQVQKQGEIFLLKADPATFQRL